MKSKAWLASRSRYLDFPGVLPVQELAPVVHRVSGPKKAHRAINAMTMSKGYLGKVRSLHGKADDGWAIRFVTITRILDVCYGARASDALAKRVSSASDIHIHGRGPNVF